MININLGMSDEKKAYLHFVEKSPQKQAFLVAEQIFDLLFLRSNVQLYKESLRRSIKATATLKQRASRFNEIFDTGLAFFRQCKEAQLVLCAHSGILIRQTLKT